MFLVVVGLYSLSELLKRSHSTLTPLQLQMSKKTTFSAERKKTVFQCFLLTSDWSHFLHHTLTMERL